MKIRSFIVVLLALLALAGCGKPVPADKAAYVGEWREKTMYLLITQDGTVSYKRLKNGGKVSVEGPLRGFEGDNFEVGVGPLATTFNVSKPPHQENGKWKMVVDDVELTKVTGPEDAGAVGQLEKETGEI